MEWSEGVKGDKEGGGVDGTAFDFRAFSICCTGRGGKRKGGELYARYTVINFKIFQEFQKYINWV